MNFREITETEYFATPKDMRPQSLESDHKFHCVECGYRNEDPTDGDGFHISYYKILSSGKVYFESLCEGCHEKDVEWKRQSP